MRREGGQSRRSSVENIVNLSVPWLAIGALALLGFGLAQAIWGAGPDVRHGAGVYILYVHVPSAWLSMFVYALVSLFALIYVVFRFPLCDLALSAALPIGAAFTLIALVSGSLWGRPAWGTFWIWDPRLVSELILLWIYLALIALDRFANQQGHGARVALSVFALAGSLILPVIHFSVDFWHSIHQGASLSIFGKNSLDPAYLWPLIYCTLGAMCGFVSLLLYDMRTQMLRRRYARLLRQHLDRNP